jgi:uncharacterized protein (DUF3084 family)
MKAGEKRIKLTVKANKTIVGEITQPKDGKSETEKIDVKDASELQTKFPEAFKLYEKHLAIRDAPANKLGSAEAIKTQLEALRKQSETISKMDRMPTEARERVLKSLDTHLEKLEKDAAEIEKARSAE